MTYPVGVRYRLSAWLKWEKRKPEQLLWLKSRRANSSWEWTARRSQSATFDEALMREFQQHFRLYRIMIFPTLDHGAVADATVAPSAGLCVSGQQPVIPSEADGGS